MKRALGTLPNLLTIGRGIAAIPVSIAMLTGHFRIAIVVLFFAGISDGLDGLLARKLDATSRMGRLLDPIADKFLLVTVFVVAAIPGFGFEPLPWWLVFLAILRDVLIVLAGYAIYRRTGFTGFTPTLLGKVNTTLELLLLGVFLCTRAFDWHPALLNAFIYATTATIFVSGFHYIFHVRNQLAAMRRERGAAAV